jgi:hypothetical protein
MAMTGMLTEFRSRSAGSSMEAYRARGLGNDLAVVSGSTAVSLLMSANGSRG